MQKFDPWQYNESIQHMRIGLFFQWYVFATKIQAWYNIATLGMIKTFMCTVNATEDIARQYMSIKSYIISWQGIGDPN